MHSDQLRYLIDIAKTNSINATAKRMFSSQQAVSESIKHLENELNCIILKRSKTGVEFTDDGKYVLRYATHMLDEYNSLIQHFQNNATKTQLTGQLIISVAPLATSTLLTNLLLKMHMDYPQVFLYAQEHPIETILSLVVQGKIDFGLLGYSENGAISFEQIQQQAPVPLHFQKLYTDDLVCVMSKDKPLSMQKMLSFKDVRNLKQTMYGYSSVFTPQNFCLHVSNNTEIHQKFMKEESTICLMPFQAYKLLYPKKDFCCLPIIDAKPIITYLVCRDEDLSMNPLYQTFIDTTVSLVQQI